MGQVGILYWAYLNFREHTGETELDGRIIAKSIKTGEYEGKNYNNLVQHKEKCSNFLSIEENVKFHTRPSISCLY